MGSGSDGLTSPQAGAIAHGLPADAYTGEAFRERENRGLFARTWVFVALAHELSRAGDVLPVEVAGCPLLLVSDGDTVRAFHNVCRHRCLKLVACAGNAGRFIQCPYHHWSYGLDGRLRATPHFGGPGRHRVAGLDPLEHGLVAVRASVWHDWVFVNLDGGAPAFADYVAPLARRLDDLDLARLTPLATLDFGTVACNWKLLMENFIEPYHVQYVHAATTDQPLREHRTVIDGACLGSAVDVDAGRARRGGTLAVSARYLTLFPNFVLGVYDGEIGVHLNTPLAVDRTHQRRAIYAVGARAFPGAEVERLKTLWSRVHAEDHAMCERLQLGRASPVARSGGLLSPHWENSVSRFQQLVLEALGQP